MRQVRTTYQLAPDTDLTKPQGIDKLNEILTEIGNRLGTIQQVGAKPPIAAQGLSVQGRQGVFWVTWNRMANVDGYILLAANDQAMTQIVHRTNIADPQQCSYQLPVGNAAVTYYFQIQAYRGNQVGQPTPAVSATTGTWLTGTSTALDSVPAGPPIAPLVPKKGFIRNGTVIP